MQANSEVEYGVELSETTQSELELIRSELERQSVPDLKSEVNVDLDDGTVDVKLYSEMGIARGDDAPGVLGVDREILHIESVNDANEDPTLYTVTRETRQISERDPLAVRFHERELVGSVAHAFPEALEYSIGHIDAFYAMKSDETYECNIGVNDDVDTDELLSMPEDGEIVNIPDRDR